MIVWADKDEEQIGLHADFKLSKTGEAIILSDPDQDIIDEVSFNEQTTDISTGRYANGTGDFVLMPPTFGYENSMSTALNYDVLVINEFLSKKGKIET